MTLDTTLFGYRWKGVFNASTTYVEGDVVYRLGGAYVWRNGAWAVFGPGQQDVTTKGHILTGDSSIGGAAGQSIFVKSDNMPEFRFGDDRNGTVVKALMQATEDSGAKNCGSNDYMMALMTNGTVRAWGRSLSGQMGVGNLDVAKDTPALVPFPPGTAPIKKIVSGRYQTYFLDEDGIVWVCGANTGNVMSGNGTTGVIPVPAKINGVGTGNEILSTTKIVDLYTGKDYGNYFCVMAKDDQGRIYAWGYNNYGGLGVNAGANTNVAKLVPFTATTPIDKVFLSGGGYNVSCLIDYDGNAYIAGLAACGFISATAGTQLNTFQRLETYGQRVKKLSFSYTDSHVTAGLQSSWISLLLLENGKVFCTWDGPISSSGIGQGTFTSVGLPNLGGTPFHTNVDDIYGAQGEYPRVFALMKDGTMQMRGRSSYYSNTTTTDAEVNAWTTIGSPYLTNVSKLRMLSGQYAQTIAAIRADGQVVIWGRVNDGLKGVGEAVGTSDSAGLQFVKCERPIVDVQFSGYCWTESFIQNIFLLDDQGHVLALGASNSRVNGYPTSVSVSVPSPIRF